MNRTQTIIKAVLILVIGVIALYEATKWTVMRVYVPPGRALMVINKFGDQLPPDLIAVPTGQEHYKGVQEQLRSPGRYFINPVEYDTQLVDLTEISPGDPQRWRFKRDGTLEDTGTQPEVGLIACKQGKIPPPGVEVVDPGFKGIQKEVLTPGTYKINPHLYSITKVPAIVVPPGFVGVTTRLTGDRGATTSVTLTEIRSQTFGPSTQPDVPATHQAPSRLITGKTQRGVLKDVLQPGIYYVNPRLVKVDIVPCGYDAITLEHSATGGGRGDRSRTRNQSGTNNPTNNAGTSVRFYSGDGYLVEADLTLVWGVAPADAPEIVANVGGWDQIRSNIIEPAMKAACQNVGAKYTSKELIQGTTRSKFQDELSDSLERSVANRSVHVLLALIRNITIKDNTGKDQTNGLLATIQRANIEIENDLTNKQKTITAVTAAKLQEALKAVDVARETVSSESNVKVANIMADGAKKAAEIDAQRDLDIAKINLQIAELESKRTQILGKATADVARFKNEAEAKGAKLLVDAFGSAQAYNLYTFAQNFQPTDLKLIFAGPGTFWTDLKSFQDVGASKVVQQAQEPKK
jgi:regulator of protease activity HflC (stomatin/prohibitin superfamily)